MITKLKPGDIVSDTYLNAIYSKFYEKTKTNFSGNTIFLDNDTTISFKELTSLDAGFSLPAGDSVIYEIKQIMLFEEMILDKSTMLEGEYEIKNPLPARLVNSDYKVFNNLNEEMTLNEDFTVIELNNPNGYLTFKSVNDEILNKVENLTLEVSYYIRLDYVNNGIDAIYDANFYVYDGVIYFN